MLLWLIAAGCASSTSPIPLNPDPAPSASVSSSSLPALDPNLWQPPPPDKLREVRNSFPSVHAGGRYIAQILASNPEVYTHPDLPDLFEVCEWLRESKNGPINLTLCIKKEHNSWRFGVLLPERSGWLREGTLEECVGCHASGVQGGLLGPLTW